MRIIITLAFVLMNSIGFSQDYSVHVVSWNVFLRPAILRDHQMDRVDSIAAYLNNTNADVLILQEVFHRRSRKHLIALLTSNYPYHTEAGKKSFWGVPSGVLILSKDSIIKESHVSFKEATGSDKLAKKGGIMASIRINDELVNFIGTHLQAGGGEEKAEIRTSQITSLSILANEAKGSIIYAGDFNTRALSPYFADIWTILNADTDTLSGKIKSTANFSDHELFETNGSPTWIDFILLQKKSNNSFITTWIEEPKVEIDGTQQRISDHNPIHSKIRIGVQQ